MPDVGFVHDGCASVLACSAFLPTGAQASRLLYFFCRGALPLFLKCNRDGCAPVAGSSFCRLERKRPRLLCFFCRLERKRPRLLCFFCRLERKRPRLLCFFCRLERKRPRLLCFFCRLERKRPRLLCFFCRLERLLFF